MNRKRMGLCVGVALLLMVVGVLIDCRTEAKAAPIELRVITFLPSSDKVNLYGAFRLIDLVNERAKGELFLKYIGGPETIPAFEQPEALRKGVIDMIINNGPYCAPLVPEGVSTQLVQYNHLEQRKSGFYELLVDAYKKMNAFYLGKSTLMPNNLYTTKPVKNLADLSGRKFRSIPSYETYYKKLGIVGVTMPNSEAYTAIERGVIEGLTTPPSMIIAMAWHEVLKYRIEPSFWTTDLNHLVNLDKWNKLPKKLQDLMIECQIEAERQDIAFWIDKVKETYAQQDKLGVKAIRLSDAESKKFLQIVYEAGWEWVATKVGNEQAARLKAAASKQ